MFVHSRIILFCAILRSFISICIDFYGGLKFSLLFIYAKITYNNIMQFLQAERRKIEMIADSLIEFALENAGANRIRDIRIGLGYTCAALDNGSCGLAYTFRNDLGQNCGVLTEAGKLVGLPCTELIPWMKQKNLAKAAVGLSVINAVITALPSNWQTGNVMDVIEIGPDETFGMVGDFMPILHVVKPKTKNLYVFERGIDLDDGVYPSETIPQYLPKCDVVVITATSILNQTIDDILPFCKNARQVSIVGPSTPLVPELFKSCNVTLLAGSVVTSAEQILQIISQGGGTMQMRPALRHVLVGV